jgi:hypothetical protein
MGWLKKAVKAVKGAAKTAVGGRTKIGRQVFKAADNIAKKGMGALTLGQITGSDRAKLLAGREDAAAAAAGDPALNDIKDEAAKQLDMPTIDSAAVEAARKKAAMLAAARGGRASTMLSDKGQ